MLPPRFDIRRHPAPRPPAALLLVLLVAAVFGGCRSGDPPAPARPDVLLITLDTLRADHTSAYGYARPTTPRLEEVARDGVRFAAAYAPMPTTLPSHASLMTGLLPRELALLKNGIAFTHPAPTLAETLSAAGWRTAAFVSSFVLDRSFGLARGFATYDDHFVAGTCKGYGQEWEGFKLAAGFCRRGTATREQAERWLEENGYLGGAAAPSDTAGGTPPPLPGHDLEPLPGGPHDDRLQQADLLQGVDEFGQRLLVELLSGLVRVGRDLLDGDVLQAQPRHLLQSGLGRLPKIHVRRGRDQRAKALAQRPPAHDCTASEADSRRSIVRCVNSSAADR